MNNHLKLKALCINYQCYSVHRWLVPPQQIE